MMGNDDEMIIRDGLTTLRRPNVTLEVKILGPLGCNIVVGKDEAVFSIGPFGSFPYSAKDLRQIVKDIIQIAKEMEG